MRDVEDEVLEALPVDIDGVVRPPVAARQPVRARPAERRPPDARGVLVAVRDAVAEATAPRNAPPWSCDPAPAAAVSRTTVYLAAFSRMIALDEQRLARLPAWWRARAHDDRVVIARRLTLDAPRPRPGGTWVLGARLRSPWRPRTLAAELVLWPHLGAYTKVRLEPARGVRVGRRYFASGQRVLDVLTEQLVAGM